MDNDTQINYELSLKYWADVPPTIDGVLGGFGFISNVDIEGSKLFLKTLFALDNAPETNLALDCGAGIGRVTKYLLIPFFTKVDVIEPDEKFLNSIVEFVGEESDKVETLYKTSLQEFHPEKKYDIVWNQWVLGYLTDADLVLYLIRCRDSLTKNGMIIVKENVTSSGISEKDEIDSSVTRSLKEYMNIFKRAKLKELNNANKRIFLMEYILFICLLLCHMQVLWKNMFHEGYK